MTLRLNTNPWNRVRYSLIAPVYDRIAPFRTRRRRSIELLALQPGEAVLIPGAGTGADLDPMLSGTGLRVVRREPAGLGGRFEIVLLEKSGGVAGASDRGQRTEDPFPP